MMQTESFPLMSRRIRRVLLVCNNYDNFSLEEDGRLDMRIAREYSDLNLSNPPVFERASTTSEALQMASAGENFDLVIAMYNSGAVDVFDFSKEMKAISPDTPIVLLASYSREVWRKMRDHDSSHIDYIFCWSGSTDLIIAIIKLLEDSLNADADILGGGVQCILLVEDSVRYYSTYLPLLYKLVIQQNVAALDDALNEEQQIFRKRARPKILMATNYYDAVSLFGRYKDQLLGVISDIGFVRRKGDSPETEKLDAGIDLCRLIRSEVPKMPVLMQSSQESMRSVAEGIGAGFLLKQSKMLTHELGEYIGREFGFGDFVVTDKRLHQIARASDLQGAERIIETIPEACLAALREKNYISRWLLARGIFKVGNKIKNTVYPDMPSLRADVVRLIHEYRTSQGLGVVARFDPDSYNDTIGFARIGDGPLGGKARGLAFLSHLLYKHKLYDRWENVRLLIPRTLAISTEYFDRFILENGLQYVINADVSDSELLTQFVSSTLPSDLVEKLRAFVRVVDKPLAIRSSSKLEDSYYQPFAGVYSTYMIPHTENEDLQLRLLGNAIKSVYASVYYAASKAYITATANVISEEKMGIVIQEVSGSEDGGYFFPTLSGTARSVNFYPVGYEKPEEGIAKIAFGLGKAVVDGDQVLRFSPAHPRNVIQTSTPELAMRDTQKVMYALNLQPGRFKTSVDDAVNLERIPVSECGMFKDFSKVVSTYDTYNSRIVDTPFADGPKVVTFAHVLRYNTFPLADIIKQLLAISVDEMQSNIEIEFAADLQNNLFHLLQIRPISADGMHTEVNWSQVDTYGALVLSDSSLGTGWIPGVTDIVYVRKDTFDNMRTVEIAAEISALNSRLRQEGRSYVLIGYGRWGSSIPTLGIPVVWSDISEAKALVECGMDGFRVDPSQGSHFFQNLTSFNVGYISTDAVDHEKLASLPAIEESCFLRHIRLENALQICVDGRTGKGVIKL